MADLYPLRSTTGAQGANVSSFNLTIPASVATGDLMIALVSWAVEGNVNVPLITAPVGWSRLAPQQGWYAGFSVQTHASVLFGKAAESGDASSTVTWTFASAVNYCAALSAYQTGPGYVWNVAAISSQTQSTSHSTPEVFNPIVGGKIVGLWSSIYPHIDYRNGSTAAGTGITTLTISVPGGTSDGDVMVAAVSCGVPAITGPAGWTAGPSPNANKGSWYRVASNEPASYIWTPASSANMTGVIETLTGVDNVTPLDVAATAVNGSVATVTWTPITAATADAWSVLFSVEDNNRGTDDILAPTNWVTRHTILGQGAASYHSSTRLWVTPGSIAPTSTDTGATPGWTAYNFALRPATASYAVPAAMTSRENRSLTDGSSGNPAVQGPGLMVLLADVAVQTVGTSGYAATKTGTVPRDVNYYFGYLAAVVAAPSVEMDESTLPAQNFSPRVVEGSWV